MKIISVDLSNGGVVTQVPGGVDPANAAVQDITVVVQHDDGTMGTYMVQSRDELAAQVNRYNQWASELASLQGMIEP